MSICLGIVFQCSLSHKREMIPCATISLIWYQSYDECATIEHDIRSQIVYINPARKSHLFRMSLTEIPRIVHTFSTVHGNPTAILSLNFFYPDSKKGFSKKYLITIQIRHLSISQSNFTYFSESIGDSFKRKTCEMLNRSPYGATFDLLIFNEFFSMQVALIHSTCKDWPKPSLKNRN